MDTSFAPPLAMLTERGQPCVLINGTAAVKRAGAPATGAAAEIVFPTRSLLKPWQFLAAAMVPTSPLWALGVGSHSGDQTHLEALQALADKVDINEAELLCPASVPLGNGERALYEASQIQPRKFANTCAGKHLVQLAACRLHDLPRDYSSESHPIQRRLLQMVEHDSGIAPQVGVDTCGMPGVSLSVAALLSMWEALANNAAEPALRVKDLFNQAPHFIGGAGRVDSGIIVAGRGRLLAKEGGGGSLVVQSLPNGREPAAGIFLNVTSTLSGGLMLLALYKVVRDAPSLPEAFQLLAEYLEQTLAPGLIERDLKLI